jgi:putative ABC transport system permease protein
MRTGTPSHSRGNRTAPRGRIRGRRTREEAPLTGNDRPRRRAVDPLWRKAPFALLRFPGLLTSIVVGALLVVLVAAAYPLFLSRSEGELLRQRISDPTIERFGAGMYYSMTNIRFREKYRGVPLTEKLDRVLARISSNGPDLDRPSSYVMGPTVRVTTRGGADPSSGPVRVTLFAGSDVLDHVDLVTGGGGGAVLPDLAADFLHAGPGDEVEFHAEGGRDRTVSLGVSGVYDGLYDEPRSGYWSPWSEQTYRQCPDCSLPPQFVFVDPDRLADMARSLGAFDADYGWIMPVRAGPLAVDRARAVARYATETIREAGRHSTSLGRLLLCCGTNYGRGFFFHRRDIEFRSQMPGVLREVDRREAAIEGPLRLLLIAGLGVAAAVVAAAAAFALAGRRTEAALLHARGWGPGRFAARSMVESLLPTLLGAAGGFGLGWWAVSTFGPAAPAAASAERASLGWAAAAGAAALLLLGLVSGISFIRTFEVHALRRRFAWVPWELLAIGAAFWVLARLRGGGALVHDPKLDLDRPSALLLAFPVLFVAGLAMLGARLLVLLLRRTGRSSERSSPATYLAVHRLTGLPQLTVLLIAAAALCLGVFVNAQTMVGSLRSTIDAKAKVFVGSDVSVQIDYGAPPQERFPLPITRATRLRFAGQLLPEGRAFDMVAIDPSTFVGAAFWNDAFSDQPLEEMIGRLRSDDGPLPVILVQDDSTPEAIAIAQIEQPVRIVGRASAFPGVFSSDPVLVVDQTSFERRLGAGGNPLLQADARTEYWIAGDTDRALAAIGQLEAFPLGTLTADEVKDIPFIAAAIDTFAMLNMLGLAAAILVIGVLIVYLQARQRARTVSNVLSLRMGMRENQAIRALVLELAAMLVIAFVLGAALGVVAGRLVAPLLDPLQTIPPAPLFLLPSASLAWTLAGIAVVALVGGWAVHRRAAAVDLGEVLRVAE